MGKYLHFFPLFIFMVQFTGSTAITGAVHLDKLKTKDYDVHLFNTYSNWTGADKSCRSNGGTLIMPKAEIDAKLLTKMLQVYKVDRVWIGLKKQNNDWKWNDGESISYNSMLWAYNEPNGEDCGMLKMIEPPSIGINDVWCTRALPYVCQIGTQTTQKVITKAIILQTTPGTKMPPYITTSNVTSGGTAKISGEDDHIGETLAIGIPVAFAILLMGAIILILVIFRRRIFKKKSHDIPKHDTESQQAETKDVHFENDMFDDGTLTFTTMRNNSIYGENEDDEGSGEDDGAYCTVNEARVMPTTKTGVPVNGHAAAPYDDIDLNPRPYENVNKSGVNGMDTETRSSQEDITQLYAQPQKKNKKLKHNAASYDDTVILPVIDSKKHGVAGHNSAGNSNGAECSTGDVSHLYAMPQKKHKNVHKDVYDNTEVGAKEAKKVRFETDQPEKQEGYETINPKDPNRGLKSYDRGNVDDGGYEITAVDFDTTPEPTDYNIYESIKR